RSAAIGHARAARRTSTSAAMPMPYLASVPETLRFPVPSDTVRLPLLLAVAFRFLFSCVEAFLLRSFLA
ncbi:MAG: hypothetical protein ABW049_02025, partial [Spongiibacteraceae bacterium]